MNFYFLKKQFIHLLILHEYLKKLLWSNNFLLCNFSLLKSETMFLAKIKVIRH